VKISALVEKGPMVPVYLGYWSRLPNRDQLLGTNAGPGSSTNEGTTLYIYIYYTSITLGYWSRLPNRDQLLGTNAGPGSTRMKDPGFFSI
jgi:hypothetical protein